MMDNNTLTLDNLSQEILDLAWRIWRRIGYHWDRDYPCCATTPEIVRRQLQSPYTDCDDYYLGVAGHHRACLRILSNDGSAVAFTTLPNLDAGADSEEINRITSLLKKIREEWKLQGIPVA
jgi:hypothetical protein